MHEGRTVSQRGVVRIERLAEVATGAQDIAEVTGGFHIGWVESNGMLERILGALVVASATHALYSIGDLLFDDTDFHVVTVSDSGSDTWITDIYRHFLIFDVALVAAGAAQLWGKIEVTEYAWTVAAVASIVGHSVGVLIGNIAELPTLPHRSSPDILPPAPGLVDSEI